MQSKRPRHHNATTRVTLIVPIILHRKVATWGGVPRTKLTYHPYVLLLLLQPGQFLLSCFCSSPQQPAATRRSCRLDGRG